LLQRFAFAAIAMMFTAAAVARASKNRIAIVKWQPHGIVEATHLTIEGAMKAFLPVSRSGGTSVKA
jgi:hypothetical protein